MGNDGKKLEKLVQLIEKSITPDATVEHNVQMPILNSKIGAKAQCDVVIKRGLPPRQTITIIEVQDRGSKVTPNDFRGWTKKLEDVGAQHLICVSRQEFPASIKEQASLSGNTIALITIKEAEPERLPLDFIKVDYEFRYFDITKVTNVQVPISKSEAMSYGFGDDLLRKGPFNINEPYWSTDKKNVVSLFLLCRDYFLPPDGLEKGEGKITFDIKNDPPLYIFSNNIFIRAGLVCEFEWTNEIIRKPVSVLTYEQDEHGTLAWILEVEEDTKKGKIVLRMPLIKSGNDYIVRNIYSKHPKDMDLFFGPDEGSNSMNA